MTAPRLRIEPQRIAVNQAEAAAALGVSVGLFREEIMPHVKALRIKSTTLYPVAELERYVIERAESLLPDRGLRAA